MVPHETAPPRSLGLFFRSFQGLEEDIRVFSVLKAVDCRTLDPIIKSRRRILAVVKGRVVEPLGLLVFYLPK